MPRNFDHFQTADEACGPSDESLSRIGRDIDRGCRRFWAKRGVNLDDFTFKAVGKIRKARLAEEASNE